MSITNIQILHDLAETALASYANLDIARDLATSLQDEHKARGQVLQNHI